MHECIEITLTMDLVHVDLLDQHDDAIWHGGMERVGGIRLCGNYGMDVDWHRRPLPHQGQRQGQNQ